LRLAGHGVVFSRPDLKLDRRDACPTTAAGRCTSKISVASKAELRLANAAAMKGTIIFAPSFRVAVVATVKHTGMT
jgi:hypothetical protein